MPSSNTDSIASALPTNCCAFFSLFKSWLLPYCPQGSKTANLLYRCSRKYRYSPSAEMETSAWGDFSVKIVLSRALILKAPRHAPTAVCPASRFERFARRAVKFVGRSAWVAPSHHIISHQTRFFSRINQAKAGDRTVGSIVCKAERELEDDPLTGYIAMLAVDTTFRKHGIGEDRSSILVFVSLLCPALFLSSFPAREDLNIPRGGEGGCTRCLFRWLAYRTSVAKIYVPFPAAAERG